MPERSAFGFTDDFTNHTISLSIGRNRRFNPNNAGQLVSRAALLVTLIYLKRIPNQDYLVW